MIINRLNLENFGLYFGKQVFDLRTTLDRNIILIGGENGAGKTTFFEALKLCLYGISVLEKKDQTLYEKYLSEKIYHNSILKEQPNFAAVELEFQHAFLGNIDTYIIHRSWKSDQDKIKEKFEIKKNGHLLDDLESDHWQDFINDLIPKGLSQLFFFDGEKIQNLAKDIGDSNQLSESFKSLLGLDLIEKLKSDLEIYSLKQLKALDTNNIQKEIESIQKEEKKYDAELEGLSQDRAQINAKIDQVFAEIERKELLVIKEGGNFAKKREELKLNKVKISTHITETEEKIRSLCSEILPFSFASTLSMCLKETIIKEESMRNNEITLKNLNSQRKQIIKKFYDTMNSSFDKNQASEVISHIFDITNNVFGKNEKYIKYTHNLSIEDANKLLYQINHACIDTPKKLSDLVRTHESLIKKIHKIERELEFAPDDAAIDSQIKEINELHKNLGALQQQQKNVDEKINQCKFAHEKIVNQLKKLIEHLKNKNKTTKSLSIVDKVQTALLDYHGCLQDKKLKEFAELFIESYNQIAHKSNIFYKIEIDPNDYSIILYKHGDKKISKSQLSEGEKQIYAIAVLWTLTKISRRPLPFIIDTPLARLDQSHRDNVVLDFFPKASHQLIILSTDTEIDKNYMSKLEPHIAKKYLLRYNDEKTKIESGYFWS